MQSEILPIVPTETGSYPVMMVEHGSDSVETESIKLIFFDPHGKVGQQETPSFPILVVEKTTVPQIVVSSRSRMEETAVRPVKHVQTVESVFGRVTVDNVQ